MEFKFSGFINKVLLKLGIVTCFHIVYDCFYETMAKLNICDKDKFADFCLLSSDSFIRYIHAEAFQECYFLLPLMKKELTLKSQTLFNIQATMELSCKKNSIVYYFQSLIIIIHDRACSNKISNSNWTELNSGTGVLTPCLHSSPSEK